MSLGYSSNRSVISWRALQSELQDLDLVRLRQIGVCYRLLAVLPAGDASSRSSSCPMLRRDEEAPVLEQLVGTAREFVSAYVLPQTDAEEEYLGRFSRGAFEPALLFGNETTARAAIASPEAQWKLQNTRKMFGTEQQGV